MATPLEKLEELGQQVQAVCPIIGVAAFDPTTLTVTFQFDPTATPSQIQMAQATIAAFNWTAPSAREQAKALLKAAYTGGTLTAVEKAIVVLLGSDR